MMTYIQKYDDVIYRYRRVVVIGIRCNRITIWYKRLSSVMSRVAVSNPEKQGSKPSPSIFFFLFFLMGPFLWVCYTTNLFIVTVKECMAELFL